MRQEEQRLRYKEGKFGRQKRLMASKKGVSILQIKQGEESGVRQQARGLSGTTWAGEARGKMGNKTGVGTEGAKELFRGKKG